MKCHLNQSVFALISSMVKAICKMRTVLSYTYVSQQTKPASRVQSLNKYAKLLAFVVKSPPIANSNYTSVQSSSNTDFHFLFINQNLYLCPVKSLPNHCLTGKTSEVCEAQVTLCQNRSLYERVDASGCKIDDRNVAIYNSYSMIYWCIMHQKVWRPRLRGGRLNI